KWQGDAAGYQAAIDKAVAWLLRDARVATVSTRDDGAIICPNSEASCKSIAWYDGADFVYATGLIAPAISVYGQKQGSDAIATNEGPLAGLTWTQIAQGVTNAYAASQSTGKDGSPAGAWRFVPPGSGQPGRWTAQPAVMALLYGRVLGAVTTQATS